MAPLAICVEDANYSQKVRIDIDIRRDVEESIASLSEELSDVVRHVSSSSPALPSLT